MTIKFELQLEIDQNSISQEAIDAIEDAILNSLPGVIEYGEDDDVCINSTTISYIEKE